MGLYRLHAHGIKRNVNPLTPNQITFCLAVTKKNVNLKIPILVDLQQIKYFIYIQPVYDIKIRAKLLLSSIFQNLSYILSQTKLKTDNLKNQQFRTSVF